MRCGEELHIGIPVAECMLITGEVVFYRKVKVVLHLMVNVSTVDLFFEGILYIKHYYYRIALSNKYAFN